MSRAVAARAVADWARIVILPAWLILHLVAAPYVYPTWIVVAETAIATLLVYWAAERRWRAHRPVPAGSERDTMPPNAP